MTSDLADRIRGILSDDPNIAEIRMFGGICFTLNGNMLVGTMKDGTLLARIGESREPEALAKPGASRMNFTGREMKGYIVVAEDELDDTSLRELDRTCDRRSGTDAAQGQEGQIGQGRQEIAFGMFGWHWPGRIHSARCPPMPR